MRCLRRVACYNNFVMSIWHLNITIERLFGIIHSPWLFGASMLKGYFFQIQSGFLFYVLLKKDRWLTSFREFWNLVRRLFIRNALMRCTFVQRNKNTSTSSFIIWQQWYPELLKELFLEIFFECVFGTNFLSMCVSNVSCILQLDLGLLHFTPSVNFKNKIEEIDKGKERDSIMRFVSFMNEPLRLVSNPYTLQTTFRVVE